MINLYHTGLQYLLSGKSLLNNANIVIYPMTNGFNTNYTTTSITSSNYLFLDSGSNGVGYSILFTSDYTGVPGTGSSNFTRLLATAGINTASPTATIATTNNTTADDIWVIRDTAENVNIGYIDTNVNLPTAALQSSLVLKYPSNVVTQTRVNNGTSYIYNDALVALYSGQVSTASGFIKIAVVKKTDSSDMSLDEIITAKNVDALVALSSVSQLATGISISNQNISTTSSSLRADDQAITLTGVNETKATVLFYVDVPGKPIIKIPALNIPISEYLIANFSSTNDEFMRV